VNLFPIPHDVIHQRPPAREPAVTAIVTLYNYGRFIESCLDSLAAQTQEGIELIVVDDASTDSGLQFTLDWLESEANRFCGHKLVSHKSNMGLPVARNTAFSQASAERVFVMDADNLLYPKAIARCMEAMTADGSAGAYTQLEYFGDRVGLGVANFWNRDLFKARNYVDAMALVSKAAWKQVGGYEQLIVDGCEDYDFWLKFIEQGLHCTFVPEILCRYRVHGQSMLHNETNPNMSSLILQLSVRHPWLDLSFFRHFP
jgi:glycosyltransferase involved in cell wall biosynthesis